MPGSVSDLKTRPHGLLAQFEEKRAFLASAIESLRMRGARIVNPLEVNAQHSRKPFQLALLRNAGLPVPRSMATNDPAAVRRFAREVGAVAYKPLAGGATVQRLERDDLTPDRLATLSNAPVLFQELVEGVSVRAYVVGRRVVASAEIHSPELDYRRDEQDVVPTRLTPDERQATVAAARACGMAFTGVDLIRGRDGFVVLECNPSPMFAIYEEKTGHDVAGPLARYLMGQRP